MSQDAAKKILETVLRHGAEQDQVLSDIRSLCSAEELDQYRLMIGQSMGSMLLDVINPIVNMYPDLRPPRLD